MTDIRVRVRLVQYRVRVADSVCSLVYCVSSEAP